MHEVFINVLEGLGLEEIYIFVVKEVGALV